MNLGWGMSFKNIAGHVPCGGCKITVHSAQVDLDDLDEVGFLAYANDRTRNVTGPDMNYPVELADVVQAHFCKSFSGGSKSFIGPTGKPTAWGTYHAMKQAVKFLEGIDSLKGKKIAVQGLGSVGAHLARYYLDEGASLVVTDVDPGAVDAFVRANPGASIEKVAPEDIYFVDAELFSPSAVGGIFTEENIPGMKFKVIAGPANNQLRASSQEEEYALARILEGQGILFVLDWWHNIGGVMAGYEDYTFQEKADLEALLDRIAEICTQETWNLLTEAREAGITPTEMAYRKVEERIYGD
jgi:glutamate dehydrogenase/leucine dehydrogenase